MNQAVVTESTPAGRVITVFSPKGGVGRSVVASNLGVLLAGRSEKPVVLIDTDLQFGDIAVMLKLAVQDTMIDAVPSIDKLDVELLQSLLTAHKASGLLVLVAPFEPALAGQIAPDHMHRVVQLLRSVCDYVVVDTPPVFNDVVFGVLEDSDDIVIVAAPDIPTIKNLKIGLQTLRLLDLPTVRLHLVLNRADARRGSITHEVERTLELTAECVIPSDIMVTQSVNKGMPVVLESPKSAASKALGQLADLIVTGAGAPFGSV